MMEKKAKRVEPDADGYISNGIYRQKVAPRTRKLTKAEQDAGFSAFGEYCSRPIPSLPEQLKSLRKSLGEVILPFVEPVEAISPPGNYRRIDMGEGACCYGVLESISNGSIEAHQAITAIEALNQIDVIEHNIDRDKQLFFAHSVRLGRLLERLQIHQFAPLVSSAVVSRPGRVKGGKSTRILTEDQEKLALQIIAAKQQSAISQSAACTRASAELMSKHGIKVSKDTLLRLLRSQE